MRKNHTLECYIDGFSKVLIYMSKNFYGGESRQFHLKDEHQHIIPLTISQKTDDGQTVTYECTIDGRLQVGNEYTLFDEHCRTAPAVYSHIVKTDEFAKRYADAAIRPGIVYTPEKTTFSLWSPVASRASVILLEEDGERTIEMERQDKGMWSAEVKEDLLQTHYVYEVRVNGVISRVCDPWNVFTGCNSKYSSVDDISLLNMPEKVAVPAMEENPDAIIYEASIRDMTSQSQTGVHHPRTFRGFTEENRITQERQTGFSYLKSLGVSHVQLMPVMDFGSVDEQYPSLYYNWGYDPAHHRALEGSYSSNPSDPRTRIEEFAALVQNLHKAGLKVNLDLVFNHVWSKENYALDRLVPDYFFLVDEKGNLSNGSFCGNDIDTRPIMSHQYFLDTCRMLIEVFDVDGFRFDLMGIMDTGILNDIVKLARSIKPDFMVYGEGWDMPSFVPSDLRASQNNQDKMPYVGHFSDRFRNAVRGGNGSDSAAGFANGNTGLIDEAAQVMCASVNDHRFDTPIKPVNYVECHDNLTMWDKDKAVNREAGHDLNMRRQILATAMVLLAQGIPFLHSGQEFGRTKYGLDNTYNRSDYYNMMDYHRRDENRWMVEKVKELISLRKHHPSFRLKTVQEIADNVQTETISRQVLVYKTAKDGERLISFFNPTDQTFEYRLNENGRCLFDIDNASGYTTDTAHIPPRSVLVFALG